MTFSHLQQWILHPETLDKESLYELRTWVARYPYFQSARLLYLKNLYLLHDATFGEELRKSIPYIADRRVLFYQIEGVRYALQPYQSSHASVANIEEQTDSDRTLYLIDSFLSTMPEENTSSVNLDYSMDYTAYLLNQSNETQEETPTVESTAVPRLRGQNLIDNFLNQADDTPILGQSVGKTHTDQVDENLVEEPIQSEIFPKEPLQKDSSEASSPVKDVKADTGAEDETFTETLAKIYIKQHRYDKALEIIKKLSLNYPKKNAYFADQIRFLEKLIINAKSK